MIDQDSTTDMGRVQSETDRGRLSALNNCVPVLVSDWLLFLGSDNMDRPSPPIPGLLSVCFCCPVLRVY